MSSCGGLNRSAAFGTRKTPSRRSLVMRTFAVIPGRSFARVYRPTGPHVTAVPFRPGISDEEFTEIADGALREGDPVVLEAVGGAAGQPEVRRPASNQMRRGPRFM